MRSLEQTENRGNHAEPYHPLHLRGGHPVPDGLVLRTVCWAAGYLGWLPALGVLPPLWRQEPLQVVGPAIDHLADGVTTVAAHDWLRERVGA